jgi:endo-1,4-beta-mannosidase
VSDVVARYKDSPALWAWEFGNETNLKADLPNAAQFRPKNGTERDDINAKHLVTILSEFGKAVRAIDPTRAIISGNSHSRASSWNNSANKSWTSDTQEQAKSIILRDNPAPLDTLCVHVYGDSDDPRKELGAWVSGRLHYFQWLKGIAREAGRPVFVGEFGLARPKDGRNERLVFEALLAEMGQAGIDLAAFWVYDLSGQEKTWNVTFDNERAYMISLTAEANRRWGQKKNPSGH